MIDERRLTTILDELEKLEAKLSCMVCGNTISEEEYQQLEDAINALRLTYIASRG